jgi:exodeoxyribonuclease VII small subunit
MSDPDRESFETLLKRLEGIVGKLESNELSLEDAIDAYQKGVTLAKEGHARLADAQLKIEEVTRAGESRPIDPSKVLEERE